MIKTFITKTEQDNQLARFLEERLDRENLGLDIFLWDEEMRCGDSAQGMMDEVRSSIIYIPIISDASLERDFVRNEINAALDTASVSPFPVVIDLTDYLRLPNGIRIESHENGTAQGLVCLDFSERNEWQIKYEKLREAITSRLLQRGLYHRDEDFYQDAETIDHILERTRPTASEIEIMVDIYLREQKFQEYVFAKLDRPDWLKHLYLYNFFSGSRNPKPVEVPEQTGYYRVPYWPALHYLLRLAESLSDLGDAAVAETLMKVVRSVSDYREDHERIDNYHTDRSFVKIMASVPLEALQPEDMEKVRAYLVESRWRASDLIGAEVGKSLLPRLLEEGARELAATLLEIVTSHKMRQRAGREEPAPVVDEFWLNEILKRSTPGIQRLFPLEAAQIALRAIDQITAHETCSFNLDWIPAIEEHPQNRFPNRYENILVRAARHFLDSAAQQDTTGTRSLLQDLLATEHPIFPRIALNCISKHWREYSDLFWPLLGDDLPTQVSLKHELYELLKANHTHFSDEEMSQALDWMETREYDTPRDGFADEEHERRTRASQKLEWLMALKDTRCQPAREKYAEYLAIAGAEPEHPGFSTWMGGVQVGSISPVEVDELLKKPNAEIAAYLREYRDQGEWYGVPSRQGLADAFKSAVTAGPQKFTENLTAFLDLPPYYLYYLLWGFNEAWKGMHDFDWEPLLSFCLQLAHTDEFWGVRRQEDEEYPGSLVSQVADLIEAGTRDDSHAFDKSLLPPAEELLIHLLENAPSELPEAYDILTAVLNSPKGRVLSAAVNYSLRYARLHKDEDASGRWAPAIKEDFTRRLDHAYDDTPEFSATAGQYLANLYWLDKEWVTSHIDELFPKDDEQYWRAAMAFYLWPGSMYRYLFLLLRGHGHYAKALQTDFDDENLRKRLIRHVVIAYLWGDKQLEDSEGLLGGLVDRRASSDLHKAVTYLWMQRGALETAQRERVLAFWRRLMGKYGDKDDLTQEERALVTDLAKLASHLDSLDSEAVDWLEVSIEHFRTEQDAWFLIEDLHRLVDLSPKEVGLVYLEILRNEIYPTFDKDHIIPVVETLYERGEPKAADRICNLYGAHGIEFLRETYDRHHSEERTDSPTQ